MKIAVLADIHSNGEALDAVLADAANQGADMYIVAGDLVSDGPSPREVLRKVRALTPHVIKGNREDYMLRYRRATGLPGTAASRWPRCCGHTCNWMKRILAYISALPEQLSIFLGGQTSLRVVHGSPFSTYELLKPNVDMGPVERAAQAITEQALVFGHNHMQWAGMVCGRLLVDPGSVGVPFNGNAGAEYSMLTCENGKLTAQLRRVP